MTADLTAIAPKGTLRAAINTGNGALVQQTDSGLAGVSPALARRLAQVIGVPLEVVTYNGARKVFEDAARDVWDIGFLAIDPARAENVAFTRPYVLIESTYAVRADSPFTSIDQADQPGRSLLVALGSAYDLYLTGVIRHATLIRADAPDASMQRFREGEADMVAGVRQSLERNFSGDPAYRVLPGRFKSIEQAMILPAQMRHGQPALDRFVRDAISDGFVRQALDDSGQAHLQVASV
jgi:polar amino acid transport system substrate-binding protein